MFYFYSWYWSEEIKQIVCGPIGHEGPGFQWLAHLDPKRGLHESFNNETRVATHWLMKFHADELRAKLDIPTSVVIRLEFPYGANIKQH